MKAYELGEGEKVTVRSWVVLTVTMNSLMRQGVCGVMAEAVRKALKLVKRE